MRLGARLAINLSPAVVLRANLNKTVKVWSSIRAWARNFGSIRVNVEPKNYSYQHVPTSRVLAQGIAFKISISTKSDESWNATLCFQHPLSMLNFRQYRKDKFRRQTMIVRRALGVVLSLVETWSSNLRAVFKCFVVIAGEAFYRIFFLALKCHRYFYFHFKRFCWYARRNSFLMESNARLVEHGTFNVLNIFCTTRSAHRTI